MRAWHDLDEGPTVWVYIVSVFKFSSFIPRNYHSPELRNPRRQNCSSALELARIL